MGRQWWLGWTCALSLLLGTPAIAGEARGELAACPDGTCVWVRIPDVYVEELARQKATSLELSVSDGAKLTVWPRRKGTHVAYLSDQAATVDLSDRVDLRRRVRVVDALDRIRVELPDGKPAVLSIRGMVGTDPTTTHQFEVAAGVKTEVTTAVPIRPGKALRSSCLRVAVRRDGGRPPQSRPWKQSKRHVSSLDGLKRMQAFVRVDARDPACPVGDLQVETVLTLPGQAARWSERTCTGYGATYRCDQRFVARQGRQRTERRRPRNPLVLPGVNVFNALKALDDDTLKHFLQTEGGQRSTHLRLEAHVRLTDSEGQQHTTNGIPIEVLVDLDARAFELAVLSHPGRFGAVVLQCADLVGQTRDADDEARAALDPTVARCLRDPFSRVVIDTVTTAPLAAHLRIAPIRRYPWFGMGLDVSALALGTSGLVSTSVDAAPTSGLVAPIDATLNIDLRMQATETRLALNLGAGMALVNLNGTMRARPILGFAVSTPLFTAGKQTWDERYDRGDAERLRVKDPLNVAQEKTTTGQAESKGLVEEDQPELVAEQLRRLLALDAERMEALEDAKLRLDQAREAATLPEAELQTLQLEIDAEEHRDMLDTEQSDHVEQVLTGRSFQAADGAERALKEYDARQVAVALVEAFNKLGDAEDAEARAMAGQVLDARDQAVDVILANSEVAKDDNGAKAIAGLDEELESELDVGVAKKVNGDVSGSVTLEQLLEGLVRAVDEAPGTDFRDAYKGLEDAVADGLPAAVVEAFLKAYDQAVEKIRAAQEHLPERSERRTPDDILAKDGHLLPENVRNKTNMKTIDDLRAYLNKDTAP